MLRPNSQVTTNLIKARELIANEKNWCIGELQNAQGQRCAHGALQAAAPDCSLMEARLLADASLEIYGIWSTPYVNNKFGHAAIMRVFDRAIALSLQDASP